MFGKVLSLSLLAALVVAVAAHRSEGAGGQERYLVQPYDTLWTIASEHYGGDTREAIWRIERANHLDGALIQPGEVLLLP